MRMSDFSDLPENSAGDLFRLLPFEGYEGVLSFLPVDRLAIATRVSKGWQYAVGCRAENEYDYSITCSTKDQFKNFLRSFPRLGVSAIRCDISKMTDINSTEFIGFTGFTKKDLGISHVTWRCEHFYQYHSIFLRDLFPFLKSLKIEYVHHPIDTVKVLLPELRRLSVVNSGRRSGKLVGGVCWTGQGLPRHLKSLHLEGVKFLMHGAVAGGDIFWTFLQQVEFSDFLLDVDEPWWEKWGTSFERGILDWVRSRPNLLRFRMKRLKRDLHEQIQQLLRERLEQRAALDARRRRLEEETDDADVLGLFGSSDEEDFVNVANLFGSDPGSPLQDDLPVSPNSPEDSPNLFGSDDD